jgi:hypothetical protein
MRLNVVFPGSLRRIWFLGFLARKNECAGSHGYFLFAILIVLSIRFFIYTVGSQDVFFSVEIITACHAQRTLRTDVSKVPLDLDDFKVYPWDMRERVKFKDLFLTLVVIAVLADCTAMTHRPAPVEKKYPSWTQPKHMDLQAQQRYYELGLKYYADENYSEAKKAFQQAIEYGPDSSLAIKAREDLSKTEQILKTLREMEQR